MARGFVQFCRQGGYFPAYCRQGTECEMPLSMKQMGTQRGLRLFFFWRTGIIYFIARPAIFEHIHNRSLILTKE